MLTEDMKRLRNTMGSMRDARGRLSRDLRRGGKERSDTVAAMMSGFHAELSQRAKTMRAEHRHFMLALGGEAKRRRETVAAMLAGFRADVSQKATTMRETHREFMASLGSEARRRRHTTATMMTRFHDARIDMARETSTQLLDFMSGIKGSVGELRQAVANLRGDLAADIAGARQAFLGPVARTVSPPAPREPEPQPQEDELTVPDDLTRIQGIGPRLGERLNDVGIFTFGQLAGNTPQDLRRLLGHLARRGNLEQWIEQARALA